MKNMIQSDYPHPDIGYFKSNHKPYYIATGEYLQQSNGFRVPFYLCHILNELGYEAYVTAQKQAPHLRTPLLKPDIINKHKADKREIVAVYTEAMWGNVLNGNVIVRWILNEIGKKFDESAFPGDLFFYWAARYSKNERAAVHLETPCVDTGIFYPNDEPNCNREGFAYYAHKYFRDFHGSIPLEIARNGISLCQDIPRTHIEVADILRNVKVLYCFEESVMTIEAAACGCTVVFVKTPYAAHTNKEINYVDYIIDIDDIDVKKEHEYNGKAYSDFINNRADIEASIVRFIYTTQQANPASSAEKDPLLQFCQEKDDIYIYGAGFTADVIYNAMCASCIDVIGFIVSDEHFSDKNNSKHRHPIIPLSQFLATDNTNAGVIIAMISQYAEQVRPVLDKHSIHTYNPVLY